MFHRSQKVKLFCNTAMANKERIWIFGRTVLLNYVILLFLGSWSILFLAFGSWRVLIWDPAGKAIDQKCFCSWDFLCYRLIRKMSIPILFSLHGSLLMDGNPPFTIWVWDWYWWSWPFIGVFSTHIMPRSRMNNWQELIVWASCIWVAFPVCSCSNFTSLLFMSPCFPPTERCRKR